MDTVHNLCSERSQKSGKQHIFTSYIKTMYMCARIMQGSVQTFLAY